MTDKLHRLMDYLYGEMQGPERRAFEKELAEDPELRTELELLQGTREKMADLPEVSPKPMVVAMPKAQQDWKRWGLRAAVAAAVALCFILFNARLEFGANGFVFAMGAEPETRVSLQEDEVLAIKSVQLQLEERDRQLEQQLLQLDSIWSTRLISREQHLRQAWQDQLIHYRTRQQEDLQRFTKAFRDRELTELAGLMQNLQLEQQQEIQVIMTNFWDHWQQTRAADLQSIESEFANLYRNVEFDD